MCDLHCAGSATAYEILVNIECCYDGVYGGVYGELFRMNLLDICDRFLVIHLPNRIRRSV
jgi:hypothetical protein